ncbi:DWNN domain-containing protein [Polychytrium aggregatum]|uniref:DWNN domain-containing protein n=1 Tax=Polychytrium aggregatum TaxID=110093 RepID=UPI0022FEEC2C|nr:DWNN domain-containing protein [Polychytrium aggregatum]KAI9208706.1 DWNN domain-containing protein [Polychytrium aggregatum]
MSIVYYKFKAAKSFDTVIFDGTTISVFDLKKEIMQQKKLGKGTDFDLSIHNAETSEEYYDDNYMVPRNTSVLVSRMPARHPGKGTAQKYVSSVANPTTVASSRTGSAFGHPAAPGRSSTMTLNNTGSTQGQVPKGITEYSQEMLEGLTEDEKIQAMFKQSNENWMIEQDRMSHQKPVIKSHYSSRGGRGGHRGGFQGTGDRGGSQSASHTSSMVSGGSGAYHGDADWRNNNMNQELPPGYICYRCGQKGHFLNQCPTHGDAKFDRPKLKRTTGIPKVFLTVVEDAQASDGVMITQTGELVVVKPNDTAWNKMAAQTRGTTESVYSNAPVPDELACKICRKLLRDAVEIPCCKTLFCDDCIRLSLLENPDPALKLKCPQCNADQSPDNLVESFEARQRVEEHIRSFIKAKNRTADERDDRDMHLERTQGRQDKEAEKTTALATAPASASASAAPSQQPQKAYTFIASQKNDPHYRERGDSHYRDRDANPRDRPDSHRHGGGSHDASQRISTIQTMDDSRMGGKPTKDFARPGGYPGGHYRGPNMMYGSGSSRDSMMMAPPGVYYDNDMMNAGNPYGAPPDFYGPGQGGSYMPGPGGMPMGMMGGNAMPMMGMPGGMDPHFDRSFHKRKRQREQEDVIDPMSRNSKR